MRGDSTVVEGNLELLAVTPILYCIQWRYNGCDSNSNHQPHDCLLNRLFGRRSKKTLKLRVTGFCEGNSPLTGEFHAQRASNADNVSIWWRHHVCNIVILLTWIHTSVFSHSMLCSRARFTNDFLPEIQIRWKLRLAVIPSSVIRSQQIFAHATTAQLSCHVQNFVAITVLE